MADDLILGSHLILLSRETTSWSLIFLRAGHFIFDLVLWIIHTNLTWFSWRDKLKIDVFLHRDFVRGFFNLILSFPVYLHWRFRFHWDWLVRTLLLIDLGTLKRQIGGVSAFFEIFFTPLFFVLWLWAGVLGFYNRKSCIFLYISRWETHPVVVLAVNALREFICFV